MDRPVVERIGQMAISAGAADYRVFRVEPDDHCATPAKTALEAGPVFAQLEAVDRYRAALERTQGVPPSLPPAPGAG
ncbi:MAG TPA: hypothetical protein VG815_05765 [Chloroflexota bacterium]|jgi:hypothetical protein|nr:hypothetical protein [Chloroflexota bacterium]